MMEYDIVIIGGGPAGLAAAIAAKQEGVRDLIILERESNLGGILNQCIHNGFASKFFEGKFTGPEFAQLLIDKVNDLNILYKLETMVLDLSEDNVLTAVNSEDGIIKMKAKAVIMAMGCREWPRSAVNIPENKYAGVFTAGTAQRFVNIEGYLPGKEVVILGSGDIGLIMARRLTIEGARVKAVVEIMPYAGGTRRNIEECLEDFDIPLLLSHTVIDLKGKDRLEGVILSGVDENKKPIKDTEVEIPCDTLLLSVGLRPENDIPKRAGIKISKGSGAPEVDDRFETNLPGIFACGNLLHSYDWVDMVVTDSFKAGRNAANFVSHGQMLKDKRVGLSAGQGIRYTIPRYINLDNEVKAIDVKFRVDDLYRNSFISLYFDNDLEARIAKEILSTGDVETITIDSSMLSKYPECKNITIKIESL